MEGDSTAWVARLKQAGVTGALHLAHSGLTHVPPEVFKLTGLVRLDLAWNDLEALPPDIGKLTKLEQLWLNSNPLAALPTELERCRRLKVLDLRDTNLRVLPPGWPSHLHGQGLAGGLKATAEAWVTFFQKPQIWMMLAVIFFYRFGEGFIEKFGPLILVAPAATMASSDAPTRVMSRSFTVSWFDAS